MDEEPSNENFVKAHVKSLALASGHLSRAEDDACVRASFIAKEVLDSAVMRLVKKADDDPMLRSASADGTPVKNLSSLQEAPADGIH